MSWSVSARDLSGDELVTALTEAELSGQKDLDEAQEQRKVAVEIVDSIIRSGVVGDGRYYANLSGHANPEFKDQPGYAQDMIMINVGRMS